MKIGSPMMLRKITAVAAPVVTAVAIASAGVAHADATVPEIGYEAHLSGNTIVTTLTNGEFQVSGSTVNVNDSAGNTVVTLPLSFYQDGKQYPMPASVTNGSRTLELTAVKDESAAVDVGIHTVASPMENLRAQQNFQSQFGIATAIGSLVGTAIGALVGLTGIVGGATVIASVLLGAGLGGIIGAVAIGGPTLLIAGIDLISTLIATPGTTKWSQPGDN
ncbi:ammonium transporter [Nocardia sp. NPDC051030]|uniref:ammonium transporter n=1 Tax=Nocardia sp. NPDC051030 TaxID=3155162 RepID=UPI003443A9BA